MSAWLDFSRAGFSLLYENQFILHLNTPTMSLNLYTYKGGSVSINLSNFIFISKSFIEEKNACIPEYQYNLPFSDI